MSDPRVPRPPSFPAARVATDVGELVLPADDRVILPYLRSAGTWEPAEGRLLRSLFTPTTRFLDVGANVGYFSLFAARACPRGTVDAVEPDPRNFELLQLNLWVHAPRVRAWPVALGDRKALVGLDLAPGNCGDTRISTAGPGAPESLVAQLTGDELFAGRGFDVVKVDVQGFELEVVRGLRGLLGRCPGLTMVVEFFPAAITDRGLLPLEVLRAYRELGLDRVASVAGRLERLEDQALVELCANAGPEGFVNLVLRQAQRTTP